MKTTVHVRLHIDSVEKNEHVLSARAVRAVRTAIDDGCLAEALADIDGALRIEHVEVLSELDVACENVNPEDE